MRPAFLVALLASLAACSRADVDTGKIVAPTPLGAAERSDRLQYLSNASSEVLNIEQAYHHQKPAGAEIREAIRLVQLAYQSAASGQAPVEASWERQAKEALEQIRQGIESQRTSQVDDGLESVKLYLDQAQQAASIEY
ncbi:MAG: hypothetical protein ACYDCL_06455 [Myxococcales bacterium]